MGRLADLTKNMSDMTQEQLVEHVKSIRHNKYVAKPAVKKRIADVEKKEKNTAIRGTNKALDKMSAADKQLLLLKLLEEDASNGEG